MHLRFLGHLALLAFPPHLVVQSIVISIADLTVWFAHSLFCPLSSISVLLLPCWRSMLILSVSSHLSSCYSCFLRTVITLVSIVHGVLPVLVFCSGCYHYPSCFFLVNILIICLLMFCAYCSSWFIALRVIIVLRSHPAILAMLVLMVVLAYSYYHSDSCASRYHW